jgi:very-short-patch-repair endonuclease/predicted transcriptional regulator of viral defense system
MGQQTVQQLRAALWTLARRQHGVVTRRQLLDLGLSAHAINHRIRRGRLHPVYRGVYAVGRPELTQCGRWMAAVLSCGRGAALSHESAAALWRIRAKERRPLEVSVPAGCFPRQPKIVVHRRAVLTPGDVTRHHGIPVTTPVCTLVDLASRLERDELEAAINEADKLDLVDPERLRMALEGMNGRVGVAPLRYVLDRRTFAPTASGLERRFLPLARRAGLLPPQTQARVNGFDVDFYWPDLGLVVETDGLRYHRTPAEQTRDRLRDQTHAAAGLTPVRFTYAQVAFEPDHVQATLESVASRLRAQRRIT